MNMREIVTNAPHNIEQMRDDMLAIGMPAADIGYGIWVQRYFGRTPPLQKMFSAWGKADENMLELESLYEKIVEYH